MKSGSHTMCTAAAAAVLFIGCALFAHFAYLVFRVARQARIESLKLTSYEKESK